MRDCILGVLYGLAMQSFKRKVTICAIVATLAIAVGIACLAKLMAPIRKGNTEDFWNVATGVNLGLKEKSFFLGQVVSQPAFIIYEISHYHGVGRCTSGLCLSFSCCRFIWDMLRTLSPQRDLAVVCSIPGCCSLFAAVL